MKDFNFQRHSSTGPSLPGWLSESGEVLRRRFNPNNKYEPKVDDVKLIGTTHL